MGFLRRQDTKPVERDGLTIREYPGQEPEVTVVAVDVAGGVLHPATRSSVCGSVYYCVAGTLEFQVGGVVASVQPGDVVHVPAREWFAYRNKTTAAARLLSVNVPAFDPLTFEQATGDPFATS